MRILIAEDNTAFAQVLQGQLRKSAIASDHVQTVKEAEQAIASLPYSAVILDLGLPDGDGLDLVRRLRQAGNALPILIISARHGLDDRVLGLRVGADDYLAKPFSVDELIARLHAITRRPGTMVGEVLHAGNVSLDTESRQVNIGSHRFVGRLREALILEVLMRHEGHVVRRGFLFDQLYGFDAKADANTVDVHIHRLRRQLSDMGATVVIHTIRGVGFMLVGSGSGAEQVASRIDKQ
ncbi:MAG: response regulator transcription factor [Reyranella sp.]|uniref:response regulator n=1 Tax=Reyranella sp. TaxID=1929291 RepID=UPI001AC9D970|nr:response regulator transcription factor [Reyranella sp.]MBN9090411.1 response regulator transcription factor [Reyranella sp.]